jgi:hypothetical protein
MHGIGQVFTKTIGAPDAAQITHAPAACQAPFWSPDGATIYYVSANGLWGVPASGGTPGLVLEHVDDATMRPDGKTVAFVRDGALWTSTVGDTAPPHQFGGAPFVNGRVSFAQFSPDGSKLARGVIVYMLYKHEHEGRSYRRIRRAGPHRGARTWT